MEIRINVLCKDRPKRIAAVANGYVRGGLTIIACVGQNGVI
jgi:hypothetical protein